MSRKNKFNNRNRMILLGLILIFLVIFIFNSFPKINSLSQLPSVNNSRHLPSNSPRMQETNKTNSSNFNVRPSSENGWEIYENLDYKIEISYPKSWGDEVGSLIAKKVIGPNQVPRSEFHDGAYFSLKPPIETSKNLKNWISEDFEDIKNADSVKIYDETIGSNTFTSAFGCGAGCFVHHFIKRDNLIFDIVTFSEGTNKSEQDRILQKILSSFKLH